MEKAYYAYMLICADGSIYSGYTVDLEKRLKAHNLGLGAKYTKGRLPVRLAYYEMFDNKSDALKREIFFKRLDRESKLKLIEDGGVK